MGVCDDLISRQDAITIPVLPKAYREYQTMNLDDAYESGWFDCQKCIEDLPPAQSEPQWTPVMEGLPDPNKAEDACLVYYLIQNEYGDMMVASYHSNRYGETWWEQMYTYKPIEDEVVAWMPLPKPWSNNVDRNSN